MKSTRWQHCLQAVRVLMVTHLQPVISRCHTLKISKVSYVYWFRPVSVTHSYQHCSDSLVSFVKAPSVFSTITDYTDSAEAFNFAQQAGSFEVRTWNKTEKVLMQVVPEPPVDTCRPERMTKPVNLIGNYKWYVYVRASLVCRSSLTLVESSE